MRWKAKAKPIKPERKVGDTRLKSGFLFFPKCLNGEWRWCEKTRWIQEAYLISVRRVSGRYIDVLCWQATDWAENRAGSIEAMRKVKESTNG